MTGAQLAVAPRLLYNIEQTPEMLSLKGTEEEFQAKVETTKTAASTKTASRERKGRGQPTSGLCGKTECEKETEVTLRFYQFNIFLRWLTAFSFEVDFVPQRSTNAAVKRLKDNKKAKLPDDRDASDQALRQFFLLDPPFSCKVSRLQNLTFLLASYPFTFVIVLTFIFAMYVNGSNVKVYFPCLVQSTVCIIFLASIYKSKQKKGEKMIGIQPKAADDLTVSWCRGRSPALSASTFFMCAVCGCEGQSHRNTTY